MSSSVAVHLHLEAHSTDLRDAMRAHEPGGGDSVLVRAPVREGREVPARDEGEGTCRWMATEDGLAVVLEPSPDDGLLRIRSGVHGKFERAFLGGRGAYATVDGKVCVRATEPWVRVGLERSGAVAGRRDWGVFGSDYVPRRLSCVPARAARTALGASTVDGIGDVLAGLPRDDGFRDDGLDWAALSVSTTVNHVLESARRVWTERMPDEAVAAYVALRETAGDARITTDPWEWCRRSMDDDVMARVADAVRTYLDVGDRRALPIPEGLRTDHVREALDVAHRVREVVPMPIRDDGGPALAPCR